MPDDPHNPDSLGDERTFVGEGDAPAGEEQSLGDGSTHAGGMDSSLSDLADLDDALDFDLPQIDLAARYEIEGELGKGGMGVVQLATDRSLQRKVAIKRIHASSPSAMKRFVTEARSIAALNHLNIVQVHEFGRDKDGPLLVLEYISGGSLLDRLKEGKLEVKDAIGITCQLCDALTLAHQKGIIHRDIKPANILLTEDGKPKLTDFGLARQDSVDHGQTQVGAVLGTIDFMPPEQRRDATATDGRSDLWSLAATLYQMITGEIPRVIDLDAVPQNLRSTFARALKQNPDDRFPTAEEFKTELRKGMATAATPVEADLVAGVCPACNTVNDASRKFCSDSTCATSLRVSCLACSQQIPIWDNVCGECGGKQPELVAARREELDAQRAKAEQLGSEFAFGEALQVAEEIGRVEDSRLQHLKAWSETFIIETTAENERQQENAANRYAEATNHYDSIDIPSAIMALETIPEAMRTKEMSVFLEKLVSEREEFQQLLSTIKKRVQERDLEGLFEQVNRAVALQGNHPSLLKLQEQLGKLVEQRDDAYQEAERLLGQDNTKDALALLERVKLQELTPSQQQFKQQLHLMVDAETELYALVKEAKEDGVIDPEEVWDLLSKVTVCQKLNENHSAINKLKEDLLSRILREPDRHMACENSDMLLLGSNMRAIMRSQATAGDALSSISDDSGPGNELIDAMPLVDLSERYEIQDVLGKGGMGEVLRALDTWLNRPVAIKRILARSTKALSRFRTEAKSIAALNHFNIVQIYDYGRDAEGPFIIMELVEGESLQEKLKEDKLEVEEAVDITCQLCDALSKAHGAGIIHRDIKPANILLTEDGVPKLTDFGLARQESVDHGQTQAGAVLGTIDFMPPEQRRDATAVDARSDLWSLAATLYQMITGKSPKVIRLDQLPAELWPVFEKMLEDDPEERYQTASEFRDALNGSLKTAAEPASEVGVDLGAGECAQCHTMNDASRKFCRECAAPLRGCRNL